MMVKNALFIIGMGPETSGLGMDHFQLYHLFKERILSDLGRDLHRPTTTVFQ